MSDNMQKVGTVLKKLLSSILIFALFITMSIPVFASDQKIEIVKVLEDGSVLEGGIAMDVHMAPGILGAKVMKTSTWHQGNVVHDYPNGYGYYVFCQVAKQTQAYLIAFSIWLVHPSVLLRILVLVLYVDWRRRLRLIKAEQQNVCNVL